MIKFEKFQLNNGLRVIVNQDKTTPMVAFNLLYDVGSKDEKPNKTGFAHLFEHLMFGGSVNVPSFDEPLQKVGGENNAFTNTDITNYYITLPKENIETAFWLESDRMLSLLFSNQSLVTQKNVVCEEFKQRYLNRPYGDIWLLLRPLAYKVHPYMWPTIGKELSHIENATMDDVKEFFFSHYAPNNAILSISGNISVGEVEALAKKWFGPIEARDVTQRNLPLEPKQTEARKLSVERDVPYDAIYKAFHASSRKCSDYYATDILSDVLSNGKSSRLYLRLVQQQRMFSEISAYITGEIENGLFLFSGNLVKGVSLDEAEAAITHEIEILKTELVSDYELEKVKNKIEASLLFSETSILNKAMQLAKCELIDSADLFNHEKENYGNVSKEDLRNVAKEKLKEENSSTLYYKAKK